MPTKKAAPKEQQVKTTETPIGKPVMITTANRGVFFGYATDTEGETIILKNMRMCIYWSKSMKGVFGLASLGPDKDCRIGTAVPQATLRNITSVCDVSPEAVAKWEAAPWG